MDVVVSIGGLCVWQALKAYEIAHDLAGANEPWPPAPEYGVIRDEVAQ